MVTAGSLAQRQRLACGRSSARSFGGWTAAVRTAVDADEVLGVLPLQVPKPSAPLSSNGCEDNSTPTADLQSQLWRLKPHAGLPRRRAGTPGGAPAAAAAAAHKVKRKRRHNRSNSGGHVEFNWPLARATAHHATDILSSQKGSGLSLQLQNNTRLGELLGA